jgi:hypothetical protein
MLNKLAYFISLSLLFPSLFLSAQELTEENQKIGRYQLHAGNTSSSSYDTQLYMIDTVTGTVWRLQFNEWEFNSAKYETPKWKRLPSLPD